LSGLPWIYDGHAASVAIAMTVSPKLAKFTGDYSDVVLDITTEDGALRGAEGVARRLATTRSPSTAVIERLDRRP